ncbi:porin [Marinobacterium weihaiense]|uniref:Porin n=1 Tax=Marinobacterium weihaiense TaxID=2851016 RepID=A0ABS6MA56_9GAMM|nr:porin [Marinobacterium weihaiense]MBV0932756.1 porin [Marinobacterium weihaiense]
MTFSSVRWFVPLALLAGAQAHAEVQAPDISLIIDAYHSSNDTALGGRTKGWGLSHTELGISQQFGSFARGTLTTVLEANEDETDVSVEEAYLQSLSLPAGMTLRAGRFLSDLGYLNGQHPHADSFTQRPLMYRAFLGGHYYDDGVGVSLVVPTDLYWRISAEAFDGGELGEYETDSTVGTWALSTTLGGDLSRSHSWQAGVSYLRNRMLEADTDAHDDHHHHEHDHEGGAHGHSHGAEYAGKHLYLADLVWKWAPEGNNRNRQLTLSAEYARATDLNEHASSDEYHEGWYGSAVYRFAPQWSAGLRHGRVDVKLGHDDHFHDGALEETTAMLAWSPSHSQTLRVQYTHQDAVEDWHDTFAGADNTVTVQYIVSFGAHDAHAF